MEIPWTFCQTVGCEIMIMPWFDIIWPNFLAFTLPTRLSFNHLWALSRFKFKFDTYWNWQISQKPHNILQNCKQWSRDSFYSKFWTWFNRFCDIFNVKSLDTVYWLSWIWYDRVKYGFIYSALYDLKLV